MKEKVYISGQMSGLSRDEYTARFDRAEELLRRRGFEVVNPTKFHVCRWSWLYRLLGYELTLMYDLWQLSRCKYIYKMPGWQQSRGANIESCWAFNFKIWTLPPSVRNTIDKKMCKFIEKMESKPDELK